MIPVVMLLAACGCFAMHTSPIVPPVEMGPAEKEFQIVWDAASEALVSYRFTVDHRDRRAGLITTDPMGSRHFFEWWRRDKVTASGALENTVQPMYRVVSVHIRKTDQGKYDPVVSITVSRLLPKHIIKKKEEYLIIGVGSSDGSSKGSGKHSPGDDILAGKIADDIRRIADQKRAGQTPSTGQKIIRLLGG